MRYFIIAIPLVLCGCGLIPVEQQEQLRQGASTVTESAVTMLTGVPLIGKGAGALVYLLGGTAISLFGGGKEKSDD